MMRKEALLSVGGYRKVVVDAEDCDLWLQIAERVQLANLERVVIKYRFHSNQVTVRKCRQQALSTLAARIAADFRRSGRPDPLHSVSEITPELLSALGATTTAQDSALAERYLWSIRNMCNTGHFQKRPNY
jgi:hypothetical protein